MSRLDLYVLSAAYLAERLYARIARRRVLVAGLAGLVAGVTAVLGVAAAADAWLGYSTPILVGLAAVWIPQAVLVAHLCTRRQPSRLGRPAGQMRARY